MNSLRYQIKFTKPGRMLHVTGVPIQTLVMSSDSTRILIVVINQTGKDAFEKELNAELGLSIEQWFVHTTNNKESKQNG